MSTEQKNEIPTDYRVIMTFRHFERTLIHNGHFSIRNGNEYSSSEPSRYPWGHFDADKEGLLGCLRTGWPEPIPSAQWDHQVKSVEVFADDLFLCPECARFHRLEAWISRQNVALENVHALITRPARDIGNWIWRGLDPADAQRLREFAASRLNVPEFRMHPCSLSRCERIKREAMREFKSENRGKEDRLSPEARAFLESKKTPPKPPPSYSSLVYLIHGSGHYKIGIAIDVRKRLQSIKTSCPFPVEIVKAWQSEDASAVERILHKRFTAHRVNGEWFNLPDTDLEMLKAIENIDSALLPGRVGQEEKEVKNPEQLC
ncbi:MAG: GIY-YIG nuclease family protein [Verrucomicrobia bacterium]|nr:GIY-YIG nuclease family protein [Verrucomicrobiota bacterium]